MVLPSSTVIVCRPLGVSMSTLYACRLELCHLTLGLAHRLSAILKAMLAPCLGCAGGFIVPVNTVCPKAIFPNLMSGNDCTFQNTAEGKFYTWQCLWSCYVFQMGSATSFVARFG